MSAVSPIRTDRNYAAISAAKKSSAMHAAAFEPHADDDENLIHSYGPTRPCPDCGTSMARVRSRPIDRFIHLFHPVYRFKCQKKDCAWEGNLAAERVIDEEILI